MHKDGFKFANFSNIMEHVTKATVVRAVNASTLPEDAKTKLLSRLSDANAGEVYAEFVVKSGGAVKAKGTKLGIIAHQA